MTRYLATIRHHTISRAPLVEASSLAAAKRKASRAFGDGYLDHEIVIVEEGDGRPPLIVARRRIGAHRWTACQIEA